MGHELERQKCQYDNRTQGKSFERGDLVWLHSPTVSRGKPRKLHHPWTGPFRVVKRPADVVYQLQHTQGQSRPVISTTSNHAPMTPDYSPVVEDEPSIAQCSHIRHPLWWGLVYIELLDDEADLECDGQEQQLEQSYRHSLEFTSLCTSCGQPACTHFTLHATCFLLISPVPQSTSYGTSTTCIRDEFLEKGELCNRVAYYTYSHCVYVV